jgi:uncharacterized protein
MNARTLAVLGCALLIAGVALAQSADNPFPRTLSVSGTAVTKVVPDLVIWNVELQDTGMELAPAKQKNDERVRAVLALAAELGAEGEDIQTGHLSIRRDYARDEFGNRGVFRGFIVSRNITMKQRDLDRMDEYLEKLISRTDIEVSFSFDSTKREDILWETRLQAVGIAKKKAEAMAGAAGVTLGLPVSISDEVSQPGPMMRGMASNNLFFEPTVGGMGGGMMPGMGADDVSSGTFAPGAIEIRVTTTAIYEIKG